MILFDGLYSFIGVLLSSASLYVCRIIKEKDNKDFHFGKYILEPLVISFNSFVLVVMCLSSMYNSFNSLISGGNKVNVTSALLYSVISTTGCGFIYWQITRKNKKENSELIKSESVQWFMDFILSASILTGFIVVLCISKTKYSEVTDYVDPLMVLFASMVCIKNPIKRFVNNLKELIGLIVPDKINNEVKKNVDKIKEEYGFIYSMSKVMKIGRSVKIEVNFVNDGCLKDISLEEMNEIKHELLSNIDTGRYIKDLEVTFVIGENMYIEITA